MEAYALRRPGARSWTRERPATFTCAVGEDLLALGFHHCANAAMSLDPLSFIAPARVKVLVIPIGRIKRSKFLQCLSRLQQENVVRLGDVSPDGRPHRSMPLQNNPLSRVSFADIAGAR